MSSTDFDKNSLNLSLCATKIHDVYLEILNDCASTTNIEMHIVVYAHLNPLPCKNMRNNLEWGRDIVGKKGS